MKLKCITSESGVDENSDKIPYWTGKYVFETHTEERYGNYKYGQPLESIEVSIEMVGKDDWVCNLYKEDEEYNIEITNNR